MQKNYVTMTRKKMCESVKLCVHKCAKQNVCPYECVAKDVYVFVGCLLNF